MERSVTHLIHQNEKEATVTFSASTKGVDLSSSPLEVNLALQGGRSLLGRAKIVLKKLLVFVHKVDQIFNRHLKSSNHLT